MLLVSCELFFNSKQCLHEQHQQQRPRNEGRSSSDISGHCQLSPSSDLLTPLFLLLGLPAFPWCLPPALVPSASCPLWVRQHPLLGCALPLPHMPRPPPRAPCLPPPRVPCSHAPSLAARQQGWEQQQEQKELGLADWLGLPGGDTMTSEIWREDRLTSDEGRP